MTELAAKKAELSVCTMTELVLPSHANSFGNVFGGTIMSWVDLCAAIAAQRHAGRPVVTAFIDDLFFHGPVKVGEVARLEARVTATFRTSMEIEVVVTGEEATSGRTWPCVRALLTFVALGDDGKPTPVPPLLHETDESRARQAEAEERRAHRLSRKSR
jgi:acyl-CoA hydrolase